MPSPFKQIVKNSLIVLNSNVALLATNFVFVFVMIRYLGLHDFGVLSLALTVLAFSEQLITLGLFPVMVSELSDCIGKQNVPRAKTFLYRYGQVQLIISFLLSLILVFVAFVNPPSLPPDFFWVWVAIAAYLPFAALKSWFFVLFDAFLRFDLLARSLFCEAVVKLALILTFFLFHWSGAIVAVAWIIVIGQVIGVLIISPAFFTLLKPWLLIAREKNKAFWNLSKSQGKWAFVTHLTKNMQQNGYPWIIKFFLGVEAVGVFSVLQRVSNALMGLLQPLDEALQPMVSGMQDEKQVWKFYNKISKYSFWLGALFFVVFSIVIPPLLLFYLGKSYPLQEITMIALLATLPLYALSFPIRSLLYKFRQQRLITGMTIASTIVLFLAGIVLMPQFGLLGVGLAIFMFFFVDFAIRCWYLQKQRRAQFSFSGFFSIDSQDRLFFEKLKLKILSILNAKGK